MHALGSALAFGNEYGDSLIVGSHPDGVITLDIDVAVCLFDNSNDETRLYIHTFLSGLEPRTGSDRRRSLYLH